MPIILLVTFDEYPLHVLILICSPSGAWRMGTTICISTTAHEQALSNRDYCNNIVIFIFVFNGFQIYIFMYFSSLIANYYS